MFCWKCGEENPDGAKFCKKCGAILDKSSETNEVQRENTGGNKKKVIIALATIVAVVLVLIIGVSFAIRNGNKAKVDSAITSETGTHTISVETGKNEKDTVLAETEKKTKVGDIIKFGSYEQDNDLSNGAEPIEWQVIGTRDGHTLLLSKYALDCKKYNDTGITWENSTLRSYLNSDFYDTAFSSSDKKRIVTAHNENPDSYELYMPWGEALGAKGGNATDDKVFLLSWTEVRDYLDGKLFDFNPGAENYNQKLLCKPTSYANAQRVYTYSNSDNDYPSDTAGCCYWWLRSPGRFQSTAARVTYSSVLSDHYVFNSDGGVRPALLID